MKIIKNFLCMIFTIVISAYFIFSASVFALYYNDLFVWEETPEISNISSSDLSDGVIKINFNMTGIDQIEEIVDDEANIYNFPTGTSQYFIYVEKASHTLTILTKDLHGFYTVPVATWSTSTGKSESQTPSGIFHIGAKEEWHVWPSGNVSPYASMYCDKENEYGGLFIHGPIYSSRNFRSLFNESVKNIGKSYSSGCLRTEVEAAYFVYELCEEGTIVKIVEGSPLGFSPYRNVYLSNQMTEPNIERFSLPTFAPSKLEFKEKVCTLSVGEKYTPEMIVTPSYAGNINGTWRTNNPSVVKVTGNTVCAVSIGSAIVSFVTDEGGITANMLLNVVVDKVDTSAELPQFVNGSEHVNGGVPEIYIPIDRSLIYLKINGNDYHIDQNVKPLLGVLGKTYQYTKAQSCAYVGEDKMFTYTYKNSGMCQISTVPLSDGEDDICEISVHNYIDKSLESSKGVKLGDTIYDIEKAYGKSYTQEFVAASNNEDSYTRVIYWAGEPNKTGVPYLYFILDADGMNVTGMGIFSARNIG